MKTYANAVYLVDCPNIGTVRLVVGRGLVEIDLSPEESMQLADDLRGSAVRVAEAAEAAEERQGLEGVVTP